MLGILISILIAVGAFIVLLPLIVFVHEYGHFKVARLCGMRVDAFSIGFGPALVSWVDKHKTRWKISAIPLGGYVKFFGDANAASAGASAKTDDGDEKAKPATTQFGSEKDRLAALLSEEEKRVCFHFKPVWQRAAVVAAGPIANFILAIVIFSIIYATAGVRTIEPVVGQVVEGSAAAQAGFEPGDRILAVGGRAVADFDDLTMRVRLSSGTAQAFTVERDGAEITLTATPQRTEQEDAFGNTVSQGRLGIGSYVEPVIFGFTDNSTAKAAGMMLGDRILAIDDQPVFSFTDAYDEIRARPNEEITIFYERDGQRTTASVTIDAVSYADASGAQVTVGTIGAAAETKPFVKVGPLKAVGLGGAQVASVVDGTLTYLWRLVTLKEDIRQMGGPIKIAKYAGQAAQIGFSERFEASLGQRILISFTTFVQLAALISVSIGLLNLLPIPVLDGGHLVYYGYEAIAGKPLSDRIQGVGFRIGTAVLGTFMVFVIVNDVMQLF